MVANRLATRQRVSGTDVGRRRRPARRRRRGADPRLRPVRHRTPAPVAPTQRLVIGGLYRYVRNPMYLAVLAVITGQALMLSRPVLLIYSAAVGAAVGAFVRWYEEPTLASRYGAQYEAYRRQVPGWWPRRPHPGKSPPQ